MITLSRYGSAVFLADMNIKLKRNKTPPYLIPKDIDNKVSNLIPNPNYKKESREERVEYERRRIELIREYLLENYLDTHYADIFMEDEETQKWLTDLRYHTEETLQCEYLHKDKHHCNKTRKTSCYTCCYECFQGGNSCKGACKFIKESE